MHVNDITGQGEKQGTDLYVVGNIYLVILLEYVIIKFTISTYYLIMLTQLHNLTHYFTIKIGSKSLLLFCELYFRCNTVIHSLLP